MLLSVVMVQLSATRDPAMRHVSDEVCGPFTNRYAIQRDVFSTETSIGQFFFIVTMRGVEHANRSFVKMCVVLCVVIFIFYRKVVLLVLLYVCIMAFLSCG